MPDSDSDPVLASRSAFESAAVALFRVTKAKTKKSEVDRALVEVEMTGGRLETFNPSKQELNDVRVQVDEPTEFPEARKMIQPSIQDAKEVEESSNRQLVVTKSAREGKSERQMSFGKGDLIEFVGVKGEWHKGILRKSKRYPLTGKTLNYPPKYVQPYVTVTEITTVKQTKTAEVLPQPGRMFIAKAGREAKKDSQLSFARGDVVELVGEAGKWRTGILRESQKYPLTGQVLKFPPNFFRGKSTDPEPKDSKKPLAKDSKKSYCVARASREAKKPDQLSFSKGDVIEGVDASGKWHIGILHKSTTYPLNGEMLKYPPKYVIPQLNELV